MFNLAAFVVEKLVDRATDGALERLWPAIDRVGQDLDQLLEGQRRQLLAPLKAAMSQLELAHFEQARDLLIEAEALEPYAPVVKMLLAITLARTGASGPALTRRLDEAFAMNPFLVPPEAKIAHYDEAESAGSWSRELNTLRVGKPGLRRWALGAGNAPTGVFEEKPLMAVHPTTLALAADPARGQEWAVLQWAVVGGPDRSMAVFDASDGQVCWARENGAAFARLVLAGSSVIALRFDHPADAPIQLIATKTGEALGRMPAAAFELLYWPGWKQRSEDPRYLQSHVTFPGAYVPNRASLVAGTQIRSRTVQGPVCAPLKPFRFPRLTAVTTYTPGYGGNSLNAKAVLATVSNDRPASENGVAGIVRRIDSS